MTTYFFLGRQDERDPLEYDLTFKRTPISVEIEGTCTAHFRFNARGLVPPHVTATQERTARAIFGNYTRENDREAHVPFPNEGPELKRYRARVAEADTATRLELIERRAQFDEELRVFIGSLWPMSIDALENVVAWYVQERAFARAGVAVRAAIERANANAPVLDYRHFTT